MNGRYRRPAGVFAQTPEGWKKYQAQDDELQQVADEEIELDRVMDAQHQAREEGADIIDDMSIQYWRVR